MGVATSGNRPLGACGSATIFGVVETGASIAGEGEICAWAVLASNKAVTLTRHDARMRNPNKGFTKTLSIMHTLEHFKMHQ